MSDLQKTVHYTTNAEKICANLIHYIPDNAALIEPFVGKGDLLPLFPSHQWETYDIETGRDSLKNPPDYRDKWVITNPPYLARNKAKDKDIFNLYDTDDLYKASLLSAMECEGGIFIIPTNFFSDERTGAVRKKFLDRFGVKEVNVFTEPVFETTTYSICSFAFVRKTEVKEEKQTFTINILPQGETSMIEISPQYDYRIAGVFFDGVKNVKNIFGRLVGETSPDYITNIKLYALDTRQDRIRLEYDENHFKGKPSDRTYATLTCAYPLSEDVQKILISMFNSTFENFRKTYCDLPLSNYRDFNRKRVGFTFVYQMLSWIYWSNF